MLIAIDTPIPTKDRSSGDVSPQQAAVVDDIDAEKRMHETLRRSERRLADQKQALELAVSVGRVPIRR
jgi:hypothetical protein